MRPVVQGAGIVTAEDISLLRDGAHPRLYEKLGSHPSTVGGVEGTRFAVWAPNAAQVSVMGDFNGWSKTSRVISQRDDGSGVWEGFVPGVGSGAAYKYHIRSRHHGYSVDKSDPFAFRAQTPPRTASLVWDLSYDWGDGEWISQREESDALRSPVSVYEVHLGSWRRVPEEGNRFLTYRESAHYLAEYVKEMGFTHVQFLPLMEHPFYGSWGYQTTSYFAPTSRYGTPQDLMYLVDHLHRQGIGVIFDWVPSHFPGDEHGLVYFDGTHLYEHADPRQGVHPEWNSYIFNYGRKEVQSFLLSSALFWIERYHADAIRIDAVASMLYLDYARKPGEWVPNEYGGKENVEAIRFLKRLNEEVYRACPGVQTIAEESTDWPMVSRPVYMGGLGFGMKWNMGWMHDTLEYFSKDPVYRKYDQNTLTFSLWYAFNENFLLPLSHDEVVYGKGSLLGKMNGDEWQRNANLRLLIGYMYAHPGKKLLFMGGEIGQVREWHHDESIEWDVLDHPFHRGIQRWVQDLNRLYRAEAPLFERDFAAEGFEWIDFHDSENSVLSFLRKAESTDDLILVVCNFTPVPRLNYRIGVPRGGVWEEVLNSDAKLYGGSGHGNFGGAEAVPVAAHGRYLSLSLTLPPLGVLFFKQSGGGA
ncbi:MAG: 1,4-alpha-glucan branching protein GlgB [Chloroflexota bacterium]